MFCMDYTNLHNLRLALKASTGGRGDGPTEWEADRTEARHIWRTNCKKIETETEKKRKHNKNKCINKWERVCVSCGIAMRWCVFMCVCVEMKWKPKTPSESK